MWHVPCPFATPDLFSAPSQFTDESSLMSSPSKSPLLSNRCRLPRRTLWFGRACLYEDRVCIRGWNWTGRYRRTIPLERIEEVKWWAVLDDVNFLLHLDDGRAVPLQLLKGAGTWNVKLHGLLGQSMLAHHSLPDADSPETVPE
jgi:hypothetical protein